MLGPVNTMFDELEKAFPESSELWMKSCNLKRSEYHGGKFEGNDCRTFLKKVFILFNCQLLD